MDNRAYELNANSKFDPEAYCKKSSEKKKSLFSESKYGLQCNTKLLMVILILFFVLTTSIFGGLFYMQSVNREEIRSVVSKMKSEVATLQRHQTKESDIDVLPSHKRKLTHTEKTKYPEPSSPGNPTSLPSSAQILSSQNQVALPQKSSAAKSSLQNDVTSPQQSRSSRKPWLNTRLPTSIVPSTYEIDLAVDMHNDAFEGTVDINILVKQDTDVILLHNVDLLLSNVMIKNKRTSNVITVKNSFSYLPNEYYVIETNSFLRSGEEYAIKVTFTGKMSSDLSGFYTSFYSDGKQKRKVASTFFSPISARKTFPCFDEPVFKANFTLILTHDDAYKSMSNMPAESTCRANNVLKTRFRPTLKMSTYILCWVISDYNYIQTEDKRISAWAHNVDDVKFGLENSHKLLSFYEEYFKISYPLKKLDIVSIPSFGPGAMENWGIITFRAERILINDKTSTEELRQKSFNIIAHELVHQWFGNLVTMEFWTDAWLKEGFANNIGVIGGSHVNKNMGSKEQVLSSFMLPALQLDSYSTSHPISTKVKTPSDIRGVFDIITYNKGSCLVGLIHEYLGDEDFRKGLQSYLRTYAYRNANQDNLWEQLSIVSGKNVKAVMDTWTLQLGYPVISVHRINSSAVEITQRRFTLDQPNTVPPVSPFGYVWKVPIIFMSPSTKQTTKYLLEEKKAVINVPEHYSMLNPDHALFYRVNYDNEMLKFITETLSTKPKLLTAQDRTGIISDQFSFVAAKMTNIGKTLEMLSYLKYETDYYPWKAALDQLSYINSLIESEYVQKKFDHFIQQLTRNAVRNISWHNTTTVNEGSLQVLLLTHACATGSDTSDVYIQASRHYKNWMLGGSIALRPSLHPVFKDCAISYGPDLYWNYAYLKYKVGGAGSDALLWSLTATNKLSTVKKLLRYSLDKHEIDAQYTPYVIVELSKRSHSARKACWEFIKENWRVIITRYGKELFMLSDMLSAVLDKFSSEDDLKDVQTFFANRDTGSGKNAVKQAVHKIKANIAWKKNNFNDFTKWLEREGH